tara:strand:- start:2166 stop:2345 length:180 start_codon:yes stop_codon:yes gene_type:complete
MNLKGQINDILNKIQKENKQVNFDSSAAREKIADLIARDLNKRSHSNQRRQSDAGSLIF